jgi:hypothetical protein
VPQAEQIGAFNREDGDGHPSDRSPADQMGPLPTGLEYRLAKDLRPCAWWAVHTHLNLDWYRERARDFNFVFTAQRDGAEKMQEAGITSGIWFWPGAPDAPVEGRLYHPGLAW